MIIMDTNGNNSSDDNEKTIVVDCVDCKHPIKIMVSSKYRYYFHCPKCSTTNVWEDYKPTLDEDDY